MPGSGSEKTRFWLMLPDGLPGTRRPSVVCGFLRERCVLVLLVYLLLLAMLTDTFIIIILLFSFSLIIIDHCLSAPSGNTTSGDDIQLFTSGVPIMSPRSVMASRHWRGERRPAPQIPGANDAVRVDRWTLGHQYYRREVGEALTRSHPHSGGADSYINISL